MGKEVRSKMRRTSLAIGCAALVLALAGDPVTVSAEVNCEVSCHEHGGLRGKLEEAKSEYRKAKEADKEAYETRVEEIRLGCDECTPPSRAKIKEELAKAKARYKRRLERAKTRFEARVSRIEEGRDSAAEVEREQREEEGELEEEAAEIAAEAVAS